MPALRSGGAHFTGGNLIIISGLDFLNCAHDIGRYSHEPADPDGIG